jgi:hypothetical protein
VLPAGDTADLARLGSPPWLLVVYGIPSVALGLYLWNGLGPHFGMGTANGRVDRPTALAVTAALLTVAAVEFAYTQLTGNR